VEAFTNALKAEKDIADQRKLNGAKCFLKGN